MDDEKLSKDEIKTVKDQSDRELEWYHYVELFLLQAPILFPSIALGISGPWRDALPEVITIDIAWLLMGVAGAFYLSKWIGIFIFGWGLIATVDFIVFGERLV